MKGALSYGFLLMTLVVPPAAAASDTLLTDFTANSPDFGWYVLNDNVMGGRSEGTFELADGKLLFTGNTNTNGGGFSSIRTKSMQLDLSAHEGIRLRVNGDGRRYTWRLTTTARWRGHQVGYWADFETRSGTWTTADIPFSRFEPKFRGRRLDGPPLDPSQITGMGLMIYDDRDGAFEFQLDSVHAYAETTPFSFADYRWERRVLVISAARAADASIVAVQDAVSASSEEFANRHMLLVTLLDDTVSTAGSRELSSEEVAAARNLLQIRRGAFALRLIGKDGSVKLSRSKAMPIEEIYDLIDGMPMRQREQRLDR